MSNKPNLLMIVSEDHSQHLGCYGDEQAKTPTLDRLASGGVRFANHHTTQAVCSPGRASILTGLYPHQNGQISLATHRYGMYEKFANFTTILKEQGYRTGRVGKLHVLPEDAFSFDFVWNDKDYLSFNTRENEVANDQAAGFMADGDEPFFMYVAYPDAHLPLLRQSGGEPKQPVTGEDVQTLESVGIDSPRYRDTVADYYNCLNRLDTAISTLLDRLEKMGKLDNTLVVFTTDHGMQLPRGKCTVYEQGLRVPWIMQNPKFVPEGEVVDRLTSHIDVLPTVLDAMGLVEQTPEGLPGLSAMKLLRDEPVAWPDYAVGQWTSGSANTYYPQRSFRNHRYKYIRTYYPDKPHAAARMYADPETSKWGNVAVSKEELAQAPEHIQQMFARMLQPPAEELYDLHKDPHEFTNLADDAEHQGILSALRERLEKWQAETGDLIADPDVLAKLTAEHEAVVEEHYPPGASHPRDKNLMTWRYKDYLQPREGAGSKA